MSNKNSNKGATMTEYALISGLVAIVAISSMTSVGRVLTTKIETVSTSLQTEKVEENNNGGNNGVYTCGICGGIIGECKKCDVGYFEEDFCKVCGGVIPNGQCMCPR